MPGMKPDWKLRWSMSTSMPACASRTSVTVAAGKAGTGAITTCSRSVTNRRLRSFKRGERAVAGEPRRLGIVRGRHVLDLDADVARATADLDQVRVVRERRVRYD